MLKLWKWYQKSLAVHPVKTQVISSGLIWGFGDIAAQIVTRSTSKKHAHQASADEDKELKINWRRVATTGLFGLAFVGPVGHFWYEGLDRFLRFRLQFQPKSLRFVATKVAIDGIIFGPLDLFVFFTYMGFASGKNTEQVKQDVKRDFLPALILEEGKYGQLFRWPTFDTYQSGTNFSMSTSYACWIALFFRGLTNNKMLHGSIGSNQF